MYRGSILRTLLVYFLWTMGILHKVDSLNFSEYPLTKLVSGQVMEFDIYYGGPKAKCVLFAFIS